MSRWKDYIIEQIYLYILEKDYKYCIKKAEKEKKKGGINCEIIYEGDIKHYDRNYRAAKADIKKPVTFKNVSHYYIKRKNNNEEKRYLPLFDKELSLLHLITFRLHKYPLGLKNTSRKFAKITKDFLIFTEYVWEKINKREIDSCKNFYGIEYDDYEKHIKEKFSFRHKNI